MKIASIAFLLLALGATSPALLAQDDRRDVSTRGLVIQANEAFRRGAFVSPIGDNALELLLAARENDPGDASVEVAILELFPIALAAADAHVAAGRRAEAARIVALIDRAVPNSATVAKLRRQLQVPGEARVASNSLGAQTP